MPAKARPSSSTLRPDQASATELIAGGTHIAIPSKQPLSELTQAPVAEYVLPASRSSIDQEEAALFVWAERNYRIFSSEEIQQFEIRAGCKGGGSEHDAWKVETSLGAFIIRRTIQDSYGFRFSSPFSYLRRMAEFSSQVPSASVSFLGVSRKGCKPNPTAFQNLSFSAFQRFSFFPSTPSSRSMSSSKDSAVSRKRSDK